MKRATFISLVGLSTVLFLLFQSCNKVTKDHISAINPPIERLIKPFEEYRVLASEGQTITTPSGTNINIPANAFVYTNGESVEGEITIKYREYHSIAEIIASGIPMHYDSAGNRNHFVSAGMFDIEGFDNNGKEILVKKDKTLLVDMVSKVDGRFNFYDLNEENGKWNYLANDAPTEREEYKKAEAALNLAPEVVPVAPRVYDENTLTFDLEVDTRLYPELNAYRGVLWTYYDSEASKSNDEIFNKQWKKISLNKKENTEGLFVIQLDTDIESELIEVVPVLKGRDYETAMAQFDKKNLAYQRIKKDNEEKKASIDQIAKFTRSFAVSGFGIYNWDIFYKNNEALQFTINFNIDDEDYPLPDKTIIYLVSSFEDRKSAVDYSYSLSKFNYIPYHENQIIAFLPNGKLAVAKNNVFEDLTNKKLKKGEKATLILTAIDKTIESTSDLENILNNM